MAPAASTLNTHYGSLTMTFTRLTTFSSCLVLISTIALMSCETQNSELNQRITNQRLAVIGFGDSVTVGHGSATQVDFSTDNLYAWNILTHQLEPVELGVNTGRPGHFSYLDSLASRVQQATQSDVYILRGAFDGTTTEQWLPGEALHEVFISQIENFLNALPDVDTLVISVSLGTNDLGSGTQSIYQNLRQIVDSVLQFLPVDVHVAVVGINPEAQQFSQLVPRFISDQQKVAEDYQRGHFVSTQGIGWLPDLIHPDTTGCLEIGRMIFDMLDL